MAKQDRKPTAKTRSRRSSGAAKPRTPKKSADAGASQRQGRRQADELKTLKARCAALEERIENDQRERREVELRAGRLESELAQAERERDAARAEAHAAERRAAREPEEAIRADAVEAALGQACAAVRRAAEACDAATRRGEREAELRQVAEREADLLRSALENAEARMLVSNGNGAEANGNGADPAAGDPPPEPAPERRPSANGVPAGPEHWRSAAHVAIRARLARQEARRVHVEQPHRLGDASRF
jgi:hypothetical protein